MSNFEHFNRGKNPYFDFRNGYESDKNMLSKLLTNAINMHGVCMQYFQTSYDVIYDPIFGEDGNRRFIRKFDLMCQFQLPREDKMWTSFGISNLDNFSMFCSKRHFAAASGPTKIIPKIGDIIMSRYAPNIYEITEVVEDVSMFLQSKQHMWEFVVKVYKDEGIELPDSMSGTSLSAYTNKAEDIFDITNDIDVEKEDIIYKPPASEQGSDDPFSNW